MNFIWYIIIAIPFVLVARYYINREDVASLEPVAQKYGGKVIQGGTFGSNHLEIPYRGNTLHVTAYPARRGPTTYQAILEVDGAHFVEMTLGTNSILQKAVGKYGNDRVLTGDDRFDFLFIVSSQDPSAVTKVFTVEVREKLKAPLFFMPSLEFTPNRFLLTTTFQYSFKSNSKTYLPALIDTALLILDQAWS